MHEEIPAETTSRPRRLGFLISGGAEHVLLVAEAIASGRLAGCEIAIVVCNIPGAPGAEAARQAGVQTVTMEARGSIRATTKPRWMHLCGVCAWISCVWQVICES